MAIETKKIIEISTGGAVNSVKELKTEIDNLKTSLGSLKEGTGEYTDALNKLISAQEQLKNAMSSSNDALKSTVDIINGVFEGLNIQPIVESFKGIMDAVKNVSDEIGNVDFDEVINSVIDEFSKLDGVNLDNLANSFKNIVQESGELNESTITVKGLKEEINSLRDALLNTERGSEEYNTILEQLIDDQKRLTDAMRAGQKEMSAAEGSYNALVNQMSALKKVWRETTDEATRKDIGKQIKEINDKLKGFDASIGDFRRNVGDYSNAITSSFSAMGGAAKGMIGPLNGVKAAFTALSAHPIIAVLTLLASLLINGIVKGFKSSEENTNKLRVAFSGFKAIGDVVLKLFQGLAGWIAKLAEGFVNFLDVLGLVTPKMKERQKLMEKQIELEKKERDAITQKSKLEKESADLRAKASDAENYSIQERIEFTQQAQQKEQEMLEIEKQILEEKVKQFSAETDLNQSTSEELTKLEELKAQVDKVDSQIADSKKQANKQITRLNKENIQEQTQANQQRLALEKEMIQQQLELAADGSDEQLRLQKELRKKELEIQQAGFKQKFKNRKDYERAMKLSTEIYNKDIETIEGQQLIKARVLEDKINEIRLLGLREGTTDYIKEQRKQVVERSNQLVLDELDAREWVISKINAGMNKEEARDTKIQSLGDRSYLDIIKEQKEIKNAYQRLSNELYKSMEADVERGNQIILNSVMPMSRYYEVQVEQLKKIRSEMLPYINEDSKDFVARQQAMDKQILESTVKRDAAYKQEEDNVKELVKAYDLFKNVEKVNPFTYNLYDDSVITLKNYYDDLKNRHYQYMLDFRHYLKENADATTESIKTILNKYLDADGLDIKERPLFKAFGLDGDSVEQIKESINSITKDMLDNMWSEFQINSLIEEGLFPQEAIDAYIKNLQDMVDTEKNIINERYENWSNLSNGISSLMGSVADIYEADLKAQVEHGKKSQQQAEEEFETIKGLRIAVAVIDTIQGALAAFMGWQDKGQPWGAIIGAVQAAAVTAAGIAQIAQIKNTKFGAGSSSSVGSVQMATVTPVMSDYQPEMTGVMTGQQETEELANAITSKPIRAYILEGDLQEAQARTAMRERESSF